MLNYGILFVREHEGALVGRIARHNILLKFISCKSARHNEVVVLFKLGLI